MKTDYFISLLVFFPLLLIQIIVVPFISLGGYVPNLTLIALVFFTLKNGLMFGAVTGFIYGMLLDLIVGSLIGSTMFSFTASGFIAGLFFNENKIENYLRSYIFILILFLTSLSNEIISYLILSFSTDENFVTGILSQSIFSSLYTSLVGSAVMLLFPGRRFS